MKKLAIMPIYGKKDLKFISVVHEWLDLEFTKSKNC